MIWYKSDILKLSNAIKERWFDVYNYELLNDRGYDVSKMSNIEIHDAKKDIKRSYFDYLESLSENDDFVFYSCIEKESMIVAVSRVVIKDGSYYIEGLETHREFRNQRYGKKCLKELLSNCDLMNIDKIYSKIRVYNIASINTHKSCGFGVHHEEGNNLIMLRQL
jgi:ribosomal protein S18 acetylase RimI-like enzyme